MFIDLLESLWSVQMLAPCEKPNFILFKIDHAFSSFFFETSQSARREAHVHGAAEVTPLIRLTNDIETTEELNFNESTALMKTREDNAVIYGGDMSRAKAHPSLPS
jgi:hypothetical protein